MRIVPIYICDKPDRTLIAVASGTDAHELRQLRIAFEKQHTSGDYRREFLKFLRAKKITLLGIWEEFDLGEYWLTTERCIHEESSCGQIGGSDTSLIPREEEVDGSGGDRPAIPISP